MTWEKIIPQRNSGMTTPKGARFCKTCVSINEQIWRIAGSPRYAVVLIDVKERKLAVAPASAHDPYSVRILKPSERSGKRGVVYVKYSTLIKRLNLSKLDKMVDAPAMWDDNDKMIVIDIPKEVMKNANSLGR